MVLPNRKQREFERREGEILDAALALCSTPDWESVTVEQIAAQADVGKGTVYKHFRSKDELLFRLMMRFYHGLLSTLRSEPVAGPPVEQLRLLIQRALRHHLQHPEYRYVVKYCERIDFKERADPAWRADFLELDSAFQAWAATVISAGFQASGVAERPIRSIMIGLHACFKGAIDMIWSSEEWCPWGSQDEVIAAVTSFMLAGLTFEISAAGPRRVELPQGAAS